VQELLSSVGIQPGDQLTEAILMLTKQTQYPDIMMAAAILSSEQMVQRLMAANLRSYSIA